jgi:hypothetical protein
MIDASCEGVRLIHRGRKNTDYIGKVDRYKRIIVT